MTRFSIALFFMFISFQVAHAEDVVRFDPATGAYQGCVNLGDTTVFLTDPNDYATVRPGYLVLDALPNQPRCRDVLPTVPERHRKVEQGQVVEMTQAEKDVVDTPTPAQLQQQADETELATLQAQLQALYDGLTDPQKASPQGKLLRMRLLERRLGR